MGNKIGQSEEMKIVNAGGGKFAIRGGKGNKLCADEYNRIICNRNRIGQWEKFKAQDAGGGDIALRGGKHNKLCADETNRIKCNRNNIGQWEKFEVQYVKKSAALKLLRGGNVVAFKGGRRKYGGRKYCADEGNNVKCNRNKIGQWEKMKIVRAGGGKFAIRGGKGNKLCADEYNRIICNRNRIGQWEKFKAQDAGFGNIALRGGKRNKLCADEANRISCNRNNIGQWEKFKVQIVKKSAALKLLRHGNVVAFKGGKGRKYCADEGNNVKCNRNKIGQWEKMKIVNAGG